MQECSEVARIPFKLLNDPLQVVKGKILAEIESKRNPNTMEHVYFVIEGIIIDSFKTFDAIRRLIVNKENSDKIYPLQAGILLRSILDEFFHLSGILENPDINARKYMVAGYANELCRFLCECNKYKDVSDMKDYIKNTETVLDKFASVTGIEENEKNEIKNCPQKYFWPFANQIIKGNWCTGARQDVAKQIYEGYYGVLSEFAHKQDIAISFSMFQDYYYKTEEDISNIDTMINSLVSNAIFILLAILSEIDAFLKCKHNQELRYIWQILKEYQVKGSEYYETRYDGLLNYVSK